MQIFLKIFAQPLRRTINSPTIFRNKIEFVWAYMLDLPFYYYNHEIAYLLFCLFCVLIQKPCDFNHWTNSGWNNSLFQRKRIKRGHHDKIPWRHGVMQFIKSSKAKRLQRFWTKPNFRLVEAKRTKLEGIKFCKSADSLSFFTEN